MAITGKPNADGLVHIECPECGTGLRVKPKSGHSNVTCAQCKQRFVLHVPDLETASANVGPQSEFDFMTSTLSDKKDGPPSRAASAKGKEERSKGPASGRYRTARSGPSSKMIAVIAGSVVALVVAGVGLMAALGVFNSKNPEPKQAAGKEKEVASAVTTQKTREPVSKPKGESQPSRRNTKPSIEAKNQPRAGADAHTAGNEGRPAGADAADADAADAEGWSAIATAGRVAG